MKATETKIFWLPEEDSGSVVLTPAPPSLAADSSSLPIAETSEVRRSEHHLHVLYDLGNGERLHLVFPADRSTGRPFVAVVPLGADGFDRIEAVARLLASLHGRVVPPDTRLTRQQLRRARRMLQAIDGHRDGASQREIARAIFRLEPMRRDDWQTAPERFATMDLIKAGLSMIAGGYRKLLRHRRRP